MVSTLRGRSNADEVQGQNHVEGHRYEGGQQTADAPRSRVKPGLTLSARGKAMSDGAEGSVVSVLNEQSRRVIQGVVTGPGLVAVGSATAAPTVVATIKN